MSAPAHPFVQLVLSAGRPQPVEASLLRRLVSGAVCSVIGAGAASALIMVGNIACARVLGTVSYGQLAIVLATTNLFTTLFSSGLGMTATRFVAEYRKSDPGRAGRIVRLSWTTSVAVGTATALLTIALSRWLSVDVLGVPGLHVALELAAVIMFFAALNGSQTGVLSGLEAFGSVAAGNLVRGTATVVLVTAGAVLAGMSGALIGYVLVGGATAIFYQLAVRRECEAAGIDVARKVRWPEWRVLWTFTTPVLITTFSFTPAAWWSNVLLARTSGYAEAGIFNAVFHWQMFILFFSSAVSTVGLPMLSSVRSERNASKYKRCLAVNFLLTTGPAVLVAVPVAIAAPYILRMYGAGFSHGGSALVWMAIASVLAAANMPVGHVLWSLDATRLAIFLAFVRGATLVVAALGLADFGAAGLAGAHAITALVQTAVTIPVVAWLLKHEFRTPSQCAIVRPQ